LLIRLRRTRRGGEDVPKKITGDMNMREVIRSYPDARKVLDRYGMRCRGCMGAAAETVSQSATTHGVDPETFVLEMNEAVGGKHTARARS
jgi:hybrid cluster-associated redox disulfide protein